MSGKSLLKATAAAGVGLLLLLAAYLPISLVMNWNMQFHSEWLIAPILALPYLVFLYKLSTPGTHSSLRVDILCALPFATGVILALGAVAMLLISAKGLTLFAPLPNCASRLCMLNYIAITALTAGVAEELAFRNYLLARLRDLFGPVSASATVSVLFCAWHWDSALILAPVYFAFSWLLDSVMLRTRSLLCCIVIHFVVDAALLFRYWLLGPINGDQAPLTPMSLIIACVLGVAGLLGSAVAWRRWSNSGVSKA